MGAKHKVKWEEHNGKNGGRTFPVGTSRSAIESFRNSKGRDPKIKRAWIEWGSLPKGRERGRG